MIDTTEINFLGGLLHKQFVVALSLDIASSAKSFVILESVPAFNACCSMLVPE